jgi:hypothetical protein
MNVLIDDHQKIFTIQEEFSTVFPYLKLEFFSQPYLKDSEHAKKLVRHNSKTLGECRILHNKGEITITDITTVVDLEQNFCDIYGLVVQVFRQSGKAWLETTITNKWTLNEQNIQGEALSKGVI